MREKTMTWMRIVYVSVVIILAFLLPTYVQQSFSSFVTQGIIYFVTVVCLAAIGRMLFQNKPK